MKKIALVAALAALLAGALWKTRTENASRAADADDVAATSNPRPARATVGAQHRPELGAASARATRAAVDRMIAAMRDAADEDERLDAMNEAHFELAKLLVDDPEALRALAEFLSTADAEYEETRVAVGAMVRAGTPEVQAAMIDLVGARADDADFLELLLPSIGFLEHPTPATERALRSVATEASSPQARNTATLSVGIMAARLSATGPERAAAIVADVAAQLESAADASDRSLYLSALGNAATPAAFDHVASYLEAGDQQLRATAVEALRRMPSADAENHLLDALAQDPSEHVRETAAWALSHRPATEATVVAQLEQIRAESSPRVVKALLSNVWRSRGEGDQAILAEVTRAAETHPSAQVRTHAAELLASLRS